jgi:hypothetical protein
MVWALQLLPAAVQGHVLAPASTSMAAPEQGEEWPDLVVTQAGGWVPPATALGAVV